MKPFSSSIPMGLNSDLLIFKIQFILFLFSPGLHYDKAHSAPISLQAILSISPAQA